MCVYVRGRLHDYFSNLWIMAKALNSKRKRISLHFSLLPSTRTKKKDNFLPFSFPFATTCATTSFLLLFLPNSSLSRDGKKQMALLLLLLLRWHYFCPPFPSSIWRSQWRMDMRAEEWREARWLHGKKKGDGPFGAPPPSSVLTNKLKNAITTWQEKVEKEDQSLEMSTFYYS